MYMYMYLLLLLEVSVERTSPCEQVCIQYSLIIKHVSLKCTYSLISAGQFVVYKGSLFGTSHL